MIGVLPQKETSNGTDQDDVILIPVGAAMRRLLGRNYIDSADIEVNQQANMEGARRVDIFAQFLAESVVLSLLGGVSDIILGVVITVVLSLFTGWSASVSLEAVTLSFAFSVTSGVIFGIYPARKASARHHIEARRGEARRGD